MVMNPVLGLGILAVILGPGVETVIGREEAVRHQAQNLFQAKEGIAAVIQVVPAGCRQLVPRQLVFSQRIPANPIDVRKRQKASSANHTAIWPPKFNLCIAATCRSVPCGGVNAKLQQALCAGRSRRSGGWAYWAGAAILSTVQFQYNPLVPHGDTTRRA